MSRYQRQDRFFKKAKQDNFVARSVYKLEELDRRFGLIGKSDLVVDLGCSPGSWLQYLHEKVGRKGYIVGYDIVPIEAALSPKVQTYVRSVYELTALDVVKDLLELQGKSTDEDNLPRILHGQANAVISDMAPKLTGIRDADQAKSVELASEALRLASELLPIEKGTFAAKLFQGRDTDEFLAEVKKIFKEVKLLKPEATREGSREVFVVAKNIRKPNKTLA